MSEEEAIKLLKEEPDYSLSYYKREYAIDIVLKENEQLHSIIKEVREYIEQYGNLYCLKHTQFKNYHQYKVILEILNKVGEE